MFVGEGGRGWWCLVLLCGLVLVLLLGFRCFVCVCFSLSFREMVKVRRSGLLGKKKNEEVLWGFCLFFNVRIIKMLQNLKKLLFCDSLNCNF